MHMHTVTHTHTHSSHKMSEPKAPEVMQRVTDTQLKQLFRRKLRKRNALVGLGLLAGTLSVYAYSMLAVKQELLDDILDEVTTTNSPSQTSTPPTK